VAVERDALAQPAQRLLVRHADHAGLVGAGDAVARMRQLRRQVAIVGQQQQAFGVVVETSHGVDVLAHSDQHVDHRRPALGIGPRAHHAGGLVQQDVALALRGFHAAPVHADVVHGRVGLGAHFSDGGTVDRDTSLGDEGLGRTPRGQAGLGQDLLKS